MTSSRSRGRRAARLGAGLVLACAVAAGATLGSSLGPSLDEPAVAGTAGSASTAAATVSPRGVSTLLAYLSGSTPGVVVENLSTRHSVRVLPTLHVTDPQIAPDGTLLAYTGPTTTPDGAGAVDAGLFVTRADGTGAPRLLATLPTAAAVATPRWSLDSSRIVYQRVAADGSRKTDVIDVRGGKTLASLSGVGTDVRFGSDSSTLVDSGGPRSVGAFYAVSFSGRRTLVEKNSASSVDRPHDLVYSPQGRFSVFVRTMSRAGRADDDALQGVTDNGDILPDSISSINGMGWSADSEDFFVSAKTLEPPFTAPFGRSALYRIDRTRGNVVAVNPKATADETSLSVGSVRRTAQTPGALFSPLAPTRLVDTRSGLGAAKARLGSGRFLKVRVAGVKGVPSGATAAVLTLTAVRPSATSWLAAAPAVSTPVVPSKALVALAPGQSSANTVTVPLGAGGAIDLYNRAGTTDVLVDVVGYYAHDRGFAFTPVRHILVDDSRTATRHLTAGSDYVIAAPWPVPYDATATTISVTVIRPDHAMVVSIAPHPVSGDPVKPPTSLLQVPKGKTVTATTTVAIGGGGRYDLFTNAGSAVVRVETTGYFAPTATKAFFPLSPRRILDTRTGAGAIPGSASDLGTVSVHVAGVAGVPIDASAVVLDLTGRRSSNTEPVPVDEMTNQVQSADESMIDLAGRAMTTNSVTLPVDRDGDVDLDIEGARTYLQADLVGYFTD